MSENEDPLKVSIRTRDESKGKNTVKIDIYYGSSTNSMGNVNDPNHGHMIQKPDGTIIYLRL